ncbi:MAG: hypothetical protein M0R73_05440 [Dehalococcoidia bacterium]|nr:hypothetical protein [Dehalococcoidia bacterium]
MWNLTPRSHPRFALTLTLIAALAVLLLACDSAPESGGATPTGGLSTEDAGTAASPVSTPTSEGSATGTAPATRTVTPSAGERYEAIAVAVETGARAVLHQGSNPWLIVDAYRPGLTAGGTAIWISTSGDEATRYALDRSVTDTAPGWSVVESADGRSRAYLVGGEDGRTAAAVVVEREGLRAFEGRTAGWGTRMVFSPDGMRFAWIDWSVGGGLGNLMLLDLATAQATTLATGLAPCACDVPQHSTWSPSGRYLAYQRHGSVDPSEHGVRVVNLESGEEMAIPRATLEPRSWVSIDGVEWVLTVGEGNRVFLTAPAAPAEDGETERDQRELVRVQDASVHAAVENSLVIVRTESGRADHRTLVFDPASGERLVVLDGEGDVVLTPEGMATAVITRSELACTALEVDHPSYEADLPCDVADVRWSPDGRYLALLPVQEGAPLRILDATTGAQREVDTAGVRGLPQWSSDSRYLLWVSGGGL